MSASRRLGGEVGGVPRTRPTKKSKRPLHEKKKIVPDGNPKPPSISRAQNIASPAGFPSGAPRGTRSSLGAFFGIWRATRTRAASPRDDGLAGDARENRRTSRRVRESPDGSSRSSRVATRVPRPRARSNGSCAAVTRKSSLSREKAKNACPTSRGFRACGRGPGRRARVRGGVGKGAHLRSTSPGSPPACSSCATRGRRPRRAA